jgi:hypothetical protein
VTHPSNEVRKLGKPAKLYAIEGGKGKHGALHTRRLTIRCTECGNKDKFYGTAYTHPMIVIDRKGYDHYDVVEMSYKSGGNVDEVVERCAECGAERDKLDIQEVKE